MYTLLRLQLDKLKIDFSFLAICTQCRKRLGKINESIEGQSAAETAVPIYDLEATELDKVRTRFILHFYHHIILPTCYCSVASFIKKILLLGNSLLMSLKSHCSFDKYIVLLLSSSSLYHVSLLQS